MRELLGPERGAAHGGLGSRIGRGDLGDLGLGFLGKCGRGLAGMRACAERKDRAPPCLKRAM